MKVVRSSHMSGDNTYHIVAPDYYYGEMPDSFFQSMYYDFGFIKGSKRYQQL